MAFEMVKEDLDEGQFWLPPHILTEQREDWVVDYKKPFVRGGFFSERNDQGFHLFPSEFNSKSDFSSPVESVAGSTETESDEDEHLVGLTRKMAHSSLGDDLWKMESGLISANQKAWALSGSPQSTLCNALGRCGCKVCPYEGLSPKTLNRSEAAMHMLYAAAEEVARLRMLGGGTEFQTRRGLIDPTGKPYPITVSSRAATSDLRVHSDQHVSYQQLQAAQFQKLKHQQLQLQMMKQREPSAWRHMNEHGLHYQQQQQHPKPSSVWSKGVQGLGARPVGFSMPSGTTTQQPQQHLGTGMRAVFLGNHGTSRRECSGTGVFLPRRAGTTSEPRQKPACSTVLLPDRVVQALNLDVEAIDSQPMYEKTLKPDYDAATAFKYPDSFLMTQQKRNSVRSQATVLKNESVRLPQDWTY